jgi:hypothetical protein
VLRYRCRNRYRYQPNHIRSIRLRLQRSRSEKLNFTLITFRFRSIITAVRTLILFRFRCLITAIHLWSRYRIRHRFQTSGADNSSYTLTLFIIISILITISAFWIRIFQLHKLDSGAAWTRCWFWYSTNLTTIVYSLILLGSCVTPLAGPDNKIEFVYVQVSLSVFYDIWDRYRYRFRRKNLTVRPVIGLQFFSYVLTFFFWLVLVVTKNFCFYLYFFLAKDGTANFFSMTQISCLYRSILFSFTTQNYINLEMDGDGTLPDYVDSDTEQDERGAETDQTKVDDVGSTDSTTSSTSTSYSSAYMHLPRAYNNIRAAKLATKTVRTQGGCAVNNTLYNSAGTSGSPLASDSGTGSPSASVQAAASPSAAVSYRILLPIDMEGKNNAVFKCNHSPAENSKIEPSTEKETELLIDCLIENEKYLAELAFPIPPGAVELEGGDTNDARQQPPSFILVLNSF